MKMNYEIKLTEKMLSLLVSSRMNVSLLKAKPELIKRKVIFSSFPTKFIIDSIKIVLRSLP